MLLILEEHLKNATVSILFHLSLGATQVCILVYSPRSGITGSTSLLSTFDIEHSAIGGGGGRERPSSPQGTKPKPTQPVGVCDEKMAQDHAEALRGLLHCPHPPTNPSHDLLGIDLSASWLPACWRLYRQYVDWTGSYFLVLPPLE